MFRLGSVGQKRFSNFIFNNSNLLVNFNLDIFFGATCQKIQSPIRVADFLYASQDSKRAAEVAKLPQKVSGGHFFSPGKSPSMPDGIRYGCWLALIFLSRKVASKTWVNHLTHTLTHNSLDSSGQGITKQHPVAP